MGTDELKELGKSISNEELGKVAGGQAASDDQLAAPADDKLGIHVIPRQDSLATKLPPRSDLGLDSRKQ